MSVRLKVVEFRAGGGERVEAFCERLGISVRSFYRIRRAWREGGREALLPASRAPHHPWRVYGEPTVEAVAALHAELNALGVDAGAQTIVFHLQRAGVSPLPSVSTVNRILARLGLSRTNRRKRPRASYTRFSRARANELWQIDAIAWHLPRIGTVTIYQVIDDATRLCVALQAFAGGESTQGAITTLAQAVSRYGPPACVLSDNGAAFPAHRLGRLSATERYLADLGVLPVSGRVAHPQTQGKVERAHQVVQQWLRARPAPCSCEELNTSLHELRDYYNHERPHQAHTPRCTPAQAWQATQQAPGPTTPIDPATLLPHHHAPLRTVRQRGVLSYQGHTLYLGTTMAGRTLSLTHTPGLLTLTDLTRNQPLTTITWPPPTRYLNLTHCQKP